ncbi:S8 family peptidase [Kitasatospora herbaricolor]|uniref:S8 family serine peptidase n=1 Tax=Kitasatospora herbaricolor TaxID=68217 RepID=A0ABZ1WIB6_9ACTN|nr:S8 family serine peptidase [Kitasatospora herbaricolor]
MAARRHVYRGLAAVAAALALGAGGALPAAASAPEGVVRGAGAPGTVPGSYLVLLHPQAARSAAGQGAALTAHYGGTVRRTFGSALHGFSAGLTERQARRLAADPAVVAVVRNRKVSLDASQPAPPSWGLDRIDQKRPPMTDRFDYPGSAGRGVTAYIVDSGVRITHEDFGGRASYGFDAVDGDAEADDGHGHGTHVAATVAGATYGVAKQASVVAVRVLDDWGSGTVEGVVAGIDWVTAHAVKPAVVNLSLGGDPDDVLDTAVRNSIASGLTYTVAAGNDGVDASQHSPARVPTAITVGATASDDRVSWFSNHGPLVDLYAPGTDITSAGIAYDEDSTTMSGTSMASPHAAGAAALYLADHRTATPAQVAAALTASATVGSLRDLVEGTPDRLLYTGGIPNRPPGPRFTNAVDVPIEEAAVESRITVTGVPGRAPADLDIAVDLPHQWPDDLVLDLVAPDGTAYRLKNAEFTSGWDDGIHTVFGVDASARTAAGVWRLRVAGGSEYFSGYLDSWALQF